MSAATRRSKRKSADVIHLAPANRGADDCLSLVGRIADEIERGEVSGLIAIILYKPGAGRKRYRLDTAGLAEDNPTLAVGAMASCQALLHGEALQDAGLL